MKFAQRYRVLQLAMERGDQGFTRWDAANEVGCFELASRVGELEVEGVRFERRKHAFRNRFGDTVHGITYVVADVPANLRDRLTALRLEHPYG